MSENRIVVGFDGSEPAEAALLWAAEEAKLRGSTVQIVHAWLVPYVGDALGFAMASMYEHEQALAQAAQVTLDRAAATVKEHAPDVKVETTLVEGGAAAALVEASKDAALVVVGSRGKGGFVGLLLGSVSHQVAGHAHCPVVITRA
jgi:nucleotide-binding universal stress UspA family protein